LEIWRSERDGDGDGERRRSEEERGRRKERGEINKDEMSRFSRNRK
jgi:hypothetical protein